MNDNDIGIEKETITFYPSNPENEPKSVEINYLEVPLKSNSQHSSKEMQRNFYISCTNFPKQKLS